MCLQGFNHRSFQSSSSHSPPSDFKLQQLPGSLRRLRLCYDAQNRTLSVPELPPHIRWRSRAWRSGLRALLHSPLGPAARKERPAALAAPCWPPSSLHPLHVETPGALALFEQSVRPRHPPCLDPLCSCAPTQPGPASRGESWSPGDPFGRPGDACGGGGGARRRGPARSGGGRCVGCAVGYGFVSALHGVLFGFGMPAQEPAHACPGASKLPACLPHSCPCSERLCSNPPQLHTPFSFPFHLPDRQLIRTFERPYREGSFVPPHIWCVGRRRSACACATGMRALLNRVLHAAPTAASPSLRTAIYPSLLLCRLPAGETRRQTIRAKTRRP